MKKYNAWENPPQLIHCNRTDDPVINKDIIEIKFTPDDSTEPFIVCYYFFESIKEYKKSQRLRPDFINLDACYLTAANIEQVKGQYRNQFPVFRACNAYFEGTVDFKGAQFLDRTNFSGAQFSGEAYFLSAQFSKRADFNNTHFSDRTDFLFAQFFDLLKFQSSNFSHYVNFEYVHFFQKTDFYDTRFSNDANFKKAQFSKEIVFHSCEFLQKAIFSGAEFLNIANFQFVNFFGAAFFQFTRFESAISMYKAAAHDMICFDNICLPSSEADLYFDSVSELQLHNCTFHGVIRLRLNREGQPPTRFGVKDCVNQGGYLDLDWEKSQINQAIEAGRYFGEDGEFHSLSDHDKYTAFALLKDGYHNHGLYDKEDKALVAMMNHKKGGLYRLAGLTGKYGTSPSRVTGTMAFVWIAFSIVFGLFTSNGYIKDASSFFDGSYLSAITLLTVGMGTPICSGGFLVVFRLAVILEGLLGLFLMSYFSVAVVRKVLR